MAPHSPKRRKLDHDHDEKLSANGGHSESGEENYPSDSDTATDRPLAQRKHTHPGSKHTQDGDDGAIYTGALYNSSMFKLQVDEMLAEVRPNYKKYMSVVDGALRRLKSLIEGIEDRDAVSVSFSILIGPSILPKLISLNRYQKLRNLYINRTVLQSLSQSPSPARMPPTN
jgi:U3 small nucleolar RNA-associated protein 22